MKIGIADTTFSRIDLGKIAIDELRKYGVKYERYTVPGIKDLPIAVKKLIEERNCDTVISLGWVGKTEKDLISYLALSIGIIIVEILTNRHVIDVTIHEDEGRDERELSRIAEDRVRKHVRNAIDLIKNPKRLEREAGMGKRQGYEDVGPILR